eukprot:UN24150
MLHTILFFKQSLTKLLNTLSGKFEFSHFHAYLYFSEMVFNSSPNYVNVMVQILNLHS